MRARAFTVAAGLIAAITIGAPIAPLGAQAANQTLATVNIPRAVSADGQALKPGTYSFRLSSDPVKPVVGQSANSEKWVELVQGGQVRGRELASVVSAADIGKVVEGTPPASGASKVQLLKGGDYLRVWINRGGTHYLVHFGVAAQ
jgi:hypothetical protein